MITAEPKRDGIRGDAFNRSYDYLVIATEADSDTMTESDAIQAVLDVTPDDVEGILRANCVISSWVEGKSIIVAVITMEYGEAGGGGGGGDLLPQTDAVYEFRYQVPSGHIYYALPGSTTAIYPAAGGGLTPPDFGGRIKVNLEGETEGLDLPSGNTTNVYRINTSASFISPSYETLVESLMGSVNSVAFKGRPIGSYRFVQCDLSVTSGNKATLTWGFQYSPNITGLTVPRVVGADITGIAKLGHQLMWQLDERVEDPAAVPKKMVTQARAIYVETVFPTTDLNQLGI